MNKCKPKPVLFYVAQRITPTCGHKITDCDINENPEHYVEIKPSETMQKLFDGFVEAWNFMVDYGQHIKKSGGVGLKHKMEAIMAECEATGLKSKFFKLGKYHADR